MPGLCACAAVAVNPPLEIWRLENGVTESTTLAYSGIIVRSRLCTSQSLIKNIKEVRLNQTIPTIAVPLAKLG